MKKQKLPNIVCFAWNILLVYIVYQLCRLVFVAENWGTFSATLPENSWSDLLRGSLLFDTSAILYTNVLYAVAVLLPLHFKDYGPSAKVWQRVAKIIYLVSNSIGIVLNLVDVVYFTYTGKRTTCSVFNEFGNESNLGSIFGTEVFRHWYLVLLAIGLIWGLKRLYLTHKPAEGRCRHLSYYLQAVPVFVIYALLSVAGMRGGFTTAVRPITISNANQYVNHPTEAAVVLNTPFSIIRTMGKAVFVDPGYFSAEELDLAFSPTHNAGGDVRCDTTRLGKNVVVLIVESFGREYIGAYNEKLEDGHYQGYAPFMDSLTQVSLSFDYTFANGRQSISGMPSILSGIPMFIEPFFLTPSSLNDVSGLAGELGKVGYNSAFFHGAENGSMGFQAFARTTGFDSYYGRTEYNADSRFNGDQDYDGTWAIWDEPFMQFYALKMSELKEPFVTSIFTASSHHPYVIPEEYKQAFPELPVPQAKGVIHTENPIHKCIRYTDLALRRFFETASRQPWFQNTIFVFTSDHTNIFDHEEYGTDLGLFGSPILFFDPSGEMPRGRRHCIAQQTDILPSVLGWLGYDQAFVAWGIDLFHTDDADTWAVNYVGPGTYQFVKGDLVIQFDGQQIKAIYNYKEDWMLRNNLLPSLLDDPTVAGYERQLKGIIQSYMVRMVNNQLIVR